MCLEVKLKLAAGWDAFMISPPKAVPHCMSEWYIRVVREVGTAKAKYRAEQIIPMLREADVEIGKGVCAGETRRQILCTLNPRNPCLVFVLLRVDAGCRNIDLVAL